MWRRQRSGPRGVSILKAPDLLTTPPSLLTLPHCPEYLWRGGRPVCEAKRNKSAFHLPQLCCLRVSVLATLQEDEIEADFLLRVRNGGTGFGLSGESDGSIYGHSCASSCITVGAIEWVSRGIF